MERELFDNDDTLKELKKCRSALLQSGNLGKHPIQVVLFKDGISVDWNCCREITLRSELVGLIARPINLGLSMFVWMKGFSGRVEKTDPRSADYPMGYSTDYPTDYPKKSTKFLWRGRKIQEPYLLFLHDHNCTKNSRHFRFRNFSTQSILFSSHSSPATCQNAVSTMAGTIGKRFIFEL